MSTYTVEVRETISHEVTVRAKSERKAKEKAEDAAIQGKCCIGEDTQCGDEGMQTKVVSKQ